LQAGIQIIYPTSNVLNKFCVHGRPVLQFNIFFQNIKRISFLSGKMIYGAVENITVDEV